MRNAKNRIGAAVGAAMLLAAAGLSNTAVAGAEPPLHDVTYTVTSAAPYDFDLFYLTAQPPSKDAYNADSYAYVKNEKVSLDAGVPWVFSTKLADPQWAIITASSTTRGTVGAPNAHCDITIDGQPAVQQDHPYSPRCQLGQW